MMTSHRALWLGVITDLSIQLKWDPNDFLWIELSDSLIAVQLRKSPMRFLIRESSEIPGSFAVFAAPVGGGASAAEAPTIPPVEGPFLTPEQVAVQLEKWMRENVAQYVRDHPLGQTGKLGPWM